MGRDVYGVVMVKPEAMRLRRRSEDNIKMDLQGVGYGGTGLSWLRIGTSGGQLLMR
jgi:hypothetical protein